MFDSDAPSALVCVHRYSTLRWYYCRFPTRPGLGLGDLNRQRHKLMGNVVEWVALVESQRCRVCSCHSQPRQGGGGIAKHNSSKASGETSKASMCSRLIWVPCIHDLQLTRVQNLRELWLELFAFSRLLLQQQLVPQQSNGYSVPILWRKWSAYPS